MRGEGHGVLQARELQRAGQRLWGGKNEACQCLGHIKQKAGSCVHFKEAKLLAKEPRNNKVGLIE